MHAVLYSCLSIQPKGTSLFQHLHLNPLKSESYHFCLPFENATDDYADFD